MKVSRMMRVGYILCVCICVIASACLFVLKDELEWERIVLDRSYLMLMEHGVAHADATIATLDSLILARVRAWSNWPDPYERLLRGTIAIEKGEYGQAIRYLQESREACMSRRFGAIVCRQLGAEILFRQANALMVIRQKRSINAAIAYFEQGLLLNSDDVLAKKSLEWLKIMEENTDGEKKDSGPHRGSGTFEKNQGESKEGGGMMRKGY